MATGLRVQAVKVEEVFGDRARCLKWKITIQAQQHLCALKGSE